MKPIKSKIILSIFVSIFFHLTIFDNEAIGLRNLRSTNKNNNNPTSTTQLYPPSYNPGGSNFQDDQEFYQAYQKNQNPSNYNDSLCGTSQLNKELPGDLIEQVSIQKADRKEINEIYNNSYYCISNYEIPEELKFLVESECIQEIKTRKDIPASVMQTNANQNFKNNQNECDEQKQPLIRYKKRTS